MWTRSRKGLIPAAPACRELSRQGLCHAKLHQVGALCRLEAPARVCRSTKSDQPCGADVQIRQNGLTAVDPLPRMSGSLPTKGLRRPPDESANPIARAEELHRM